MLLSQWHDQQKLHGSDFMINRWGVSEIICAPRRGLYVALFLCLTGSCQTHLLESKRILPKTSETITSTLKQRRFPLCRLYGHAWRLGFKTPVEHSLYSDSETWATSLSLSHHNQPWAKTYLIWLLWDVSTGFSHSSFHLCSDEWRGRFWWPQKVMWISWK